MLRGFYTAASGMLSQEKRLNTIANNISNVSTVGFKREDLALGTFGEHVAVRMNAYNAAPTNNIGSGVWMQVSDERFTRFEQGGFDPTGRGLDMAIRGDGFFVIGTPEGDRLTRDGQFSLDADGYLELPGFGRVQGVNGDINLFGRSDFVVARNGDIFLPGAGGELGLVDRLAIALPGDPSALERDPSKLWYAPGGFELMGEVPESTMIMQHHLERSNVDMTDEMTRMMASQRSLQSASQLVRMFDEMSEQGVQRISRM